MNHDLLNDEQLNSVHAGKGDGSGTGGGGGNGTGPGTGGGDGLGWLRRLLGSLFTETAKVGGHPHHLN